MAIAVFALLACASAQEGPSFSGTVAEWDHGRGDLVMHSAAHGPPPARREDDQPIIGEIHSDGSFEFHLPAEVPEADRVPIVTGIGECADVRADPEGVRFFPLDVMVYDEDGRRLGLLFPVSPGGGEGPVVPGYSVLMNWTERAVHVRGSCIDEGRRVEEEYDAAVDPGWHLLVQRFDDHPARDGWRIDRWRVEAMPDDVRWVLLTPY